MLQRALQKYFNNFKGFSREIWILALITFINRAGTMVLPFLSKYLKEDDILLKVNGNIIDHNGFIKFDFYPEKIPIDDIGLWFTIGDSITFDIYNIKNESINTSTF